jgi:uncharacterized SAM-binding protein YcdF (DUF218 family)
MESRRVPDHAAITEYVDAATAGIGPADFVIVFGNRFPDPAPIAASIYHKGLSPHIVLTGGVNGELPALVEADAHAELVKAAGVPANAIIIERQSRNTLENVTFARPLIQLVTGEPEAAIAVVKWFHRRAVLLLARNIPSLRRIFTVTYEPPDLDSGKPVTRDNWPQLDADRIRREFDAIQNLLKNRQVDELAASGRGWTRL